MNRISVDTTLTHSILFCSFLRISYLVASLAWRCVPVLNGMLVINSLAVMQIYRHLRADNMILTLFHRVRVVMATVSATCTVGHQFVEKFVVYEPSFAIFW